MLSIGGLTVRIQKNIFFLDINKTFPIIKIGLYFDSCHYLLFGKKGLFVRFYRRYCLFLLLMSFIIPLNVAYLNFDYYSRIELQVRKHFSPEEEESLLVLFKKNPRLIYAPVASAQNHLFPLLEVSFLPPGGIILPSPNNLVLRC